jgi:hypothetical protein
MFDFIIHFLGVCPDSHTHIDILDLFTNNVHILHICSLYIQQIILYFKNIKYFI